MKRVNWSGFFSGVLAGTLLIAGVHAQAAGLIGYTGKSWESDAGVLSGECDTAMVLSKPESMAGLSPSSIHELPFEFSATEASLIADGSCLAQTLELAPSGQSVHWKNPVSGADNYLTPGADREACRTFVGIHVLETQKKRFKGKACSPQVGVWTLSQ